MESVWKEQQLLLIAPPS